MNVFNALPSVVTNDIERFAASYPNPGGIPWHSSAGPGDKEGSFTIRTWDSKVRNNHLCWIRFDIKDHSHSSQVTTSICAPAHHAAKVRRHIFKELLKTYGCE